METTTLKHDPLWYKDAVIYELHVKAFFDGNGDGIGDFLGLTRKLDYLQDLGVTCLWLLPFYPSPLRDDGYDISDYRGVHPAYGTRRDFLAFVRQAHRRGMRVITELVINHTSDQHPWFQAARKAPPGSRKRDFYVWSPTDQRYKEARVIFKDFEKSNWTWDSAAGAYYWHRFYSHQPDLNYDNPRVERAMLRVMRFWLDMGVDGLRLDAVPYLVEREGTNCENLPETHAVLKRLRLELDARYQDRMFLAEVNQWPADVRPYFGDGDECHMAFHFPLMPRIFMALRQEDRHPITEILRQTPDIPPQCQWAIFLRNHDELTLEMVTDQERDYMYNEYAADPAMRLNLGIRRRLASLVDNSRRRLELLHSLLFSFPGTPIIYYGDEIGMGDNFYLGDRNGVRTPMQWSSDRNAGFSRADFAKLYCPPVMDPVYGYASVNVEAQQRDPSSFLNWIKRMIAVSKRYKTFGRGTLEFLNPPNRKVLAYVRRYGDEIFLAVANLSRFVQPAELDLSAFEGLRPVEMLGQVDFPKVGKMPYFLTLGPHSFYWFQLVRVPAPALVTRPVAAEKAEVLASIVLEGTWEKLFEGRARAVLEGDILPKFITRQRWYGGKSKRVRGMRVAEAALLRAGPPPIYLCLVEIAYERDETETYVVPLGIVTGPEAEALRREQPGAVIALLETPAVAGVLYDGLADDDFCRLLLGAIARQERFPTAHGQVDAFTTTAFPPQSDLPASPWKVLRGGDQSNTSVRFDERFILKLFRRLEPGANPDFEMSRYLTERAHFERAAKTAGALEFRSPGRAPTTLALLQVHINNQGNGWDRALEELGRYYENIAALPPSGPAEPAAPLRESPQAAELLAPYFHSARRLGLRTAQLHGVLAENADDPAFAPEPFGASDFTQEARAVVESSRRALEKLESARETVPPRLRPEIPRLFEARARLSSRLADRPAFTEVPRGKIRCHGDYHLGQVLWADNDFYILDFEGEPARPLSQRRAKQSPLRDVAGMLRSFHYAAYSSLLKFTSERPELFTRLKPWADLWQSRIGAEFLAEYRATADGLGYIPAKPEDFEALLDLFLLEKAFYELSYELDNRPDWVEIPLHGLVGLIAAAPQLAAAVG